MISRGRLVFIAFSLTTVFLLATATMLAANERQQEDGSDSLYKYLAVFTEVFSLVDRAYVDELEQDSLIAGAFEGTLDALDPFSLYVPEESTEAYERILKVGVRHSGLLVLKERGVAYIVAVDEGSPGEEAGLKPGQIISALDGKRTRKMSLLEIQSTLAGPAGSTVELEKIDQGQKEILTVTLNEYPHPSVELAVKRGVPVLRLPSFHSGTPEDVEASLKSLVSGEPPLPGLEVSDKLVLDLRGVAGGNETAAYEVAGLFATGSLGALKSRGGDVETYDRGEPPRWQGQLVVLIDRATQGPAEILASVLDQMAEAKLVGERSFGYSGQRGLVQLSNGNQLLLTQAFYTGPDREPLKQSLQPDLRVSPNLEETEEPGKDEVLDRGLEVLLDDESLPEERQAA